LQTEKKKTRDGGRRDIKKGEEKRLSVAPSWEGEVKRGRRTKNLL